jgi:cytochrome c-type biogenesis protein CcmH
MHRLKSSFLLVALAAAALAQSASQKPSVDVRRVGHRLACQCGCVDTVATCSMLECHFSKPAKERIARLQTAGISDQAIVDQFVQEYGPGIYRAEPSAYGWIVPYAGILPGLALIWWFVRRYYRPRPAPATGPALDDPELAKYNEQIEKDLSRLD